ncbi:hypothetical protein V6N13_118467 [Hibiscus sabdariffa]
MESAWQGIRQEGVSDSLVIKMRAMKVVLKECNRDSFGNVDSKYQEIVDEIEELDARFNEDCGRLSGEKNPGFFGWLRGIETQTFSIDKKG